MEHATLDDDTLALLRASLERYRRERYDFETRKARLARTDACDPAVWAAYAEMGWLALPLAPEEGGFGSDARAVGALCEYSGAALALEPLFASVVLGGRVLGLVASAASAAAAREADGTARGPAAGEAAAAALVGLAAGQVVLALAHAESDTDGGADAAVPLATRWSGGPSAGHLSGTKRMVLGGDRADQLVVSARDATGTLVLLLVNAHQSGVRRAPMRLIDGRGAARLEFTAATAIPLLRGAAAAAVLDQTLLEARLALAAEGVGAAAALNALTLAYVKERRQFGRPIGSNQALQHRLVDLYMLEQEGRAMLAAAWRADAAERAVAIPAALAQVMTLARQAAHEAVQLHGGIGITEELAVSHYFRRCMVVNRLLGDRDAQLRACAGSNAF